MKKKAILSKTLMQFGGAKALDAYWGPERLTVLAYHRIDDSSTPEFDFYEPNVSAAPAMFAQHMAYVAEHFNIISLADLVAFLEEDAPLPPRALLITFDDGYVDNYQNAFPILKQRGFPAVIFLMTDGMTSQRRPWWDECAYYFHHTAMTDAELPFIGRQTFTTVEERQAVREVLMRALKQVSQTEKQAAMQALPRALDVPPPQGESQLFVTWAQVREMVSEGVACQPHTVHHPILTRITPDEVQAEVEQSGAQIAQETGQRITAFAYPNGTLHDYDTTTIQTLALLDYKAAFTLEAGPVRYDMLRQHPLEIPRVYMGRRDTFEMFVMKTMGLPSVRSGPTFHG